MISDTDALELQKIIKSDYQVELDVEEVKKKGERLIDLYSAFFSEVEVKYER